MNFEEYLQSKRIDSAAFKAAEGHLWTAWCKEFEQMHPASFTSHKLFLINPIRRKYQLALSPIKPAPDVVPVTKPEQVKEGIPSSDISAKEPLTPSSAEPAKAKPAIPRPVFKPKPKMN